MAVAGYETKFTQLSHFSYDLISIEECKGFYFQEGLSQFLKDKIFLQKWKRVIAKRSVKEL